MKGKGWFGQKHRHGLASKGIKSKYISIKGEKIDIENEVYRTLSTIEYGDLIDLLDGYASDEEKIEWVEEWFKQGDYEYYFSKDMKFIFVKNTYIEGSDFEKRNVMDEWERQTETQDYNSLVNTVYNYMKPDERIDWIKNWHMGD